MTHDMITSERTSGEPPPHSEADEGFPVKWQERLLPVMTGLLVGLAVFFFVATFVQMSYLHQRILDFPIIDLGTLSHTDLVTGAATFDERLAARRLEIQARMEAYLIERRYHQASVLLMSGLWVRYLGFITGMILTLVGASFVLGKLREPVSEVAGKWSAADFSLKSASPGIILVVLGTLLMLATILDRDLYEVQDIPIYLSGREEIATPPVRPAGTLMSPQDFVTPPPE